jgi:hypothetical protein
VHFWIESPGFIRQRWDEQQSENLTLTINSEKASRDNAAGGLEEKKMKREIRLLGGYYPGRLIRVDVLDKMPAVGEDFDGDQVVKIEELKTDYSQPRVDSLDGIEKVVKIWTINEFGDERYSIQAIACNDEEENED